MLLIQHINLLWDKECRGAPYSSLRNNMARAYDLPKTFFNYNPLGFPSHYIFLRQEKRGLSEQINRVDTIAKNSNIRIGAIEILQQTNCYELQYRYDFHRAIPERHKYNPKTSMYEPLKETAMELQCGEYGRIIYNGRYVDIDTGYWYYVMNIINIICTTENRSSLKIFIEREPGKAYNQIAMLR